MNAYRAKPLRYPWPLIAYATAIGVSVLAGEVLTPIRLAAPHPYLLPALGLMLGLSAVALDIWAVKTLMERQTPVIDTGCARHLVTTGPFRFSRNPIYLGYTLLTIAIGLMTGNAWFLAGAAVAAAMTSQIAIRCEEQHLEARFGFDYECYRKRTRRWI